ncbi:MAG: cystathionine beta-lyase [Parvibaculaceae bacterium]
MAKSKTDPKTLKPATRLIATARDYSEHGIVSPAVYHASTILYPTYQALKEKTQAYQYGRRGTPTSRAVETAIATLENGFASKVAPSGLAAVTTTLLSFLKPGDHLLMTDSVYAPVRTFCDTLLRNWGVVTEYYDPLLGGAVSAFIRASTRIVYCESPGSQTMEMQDVPAIAEAAHKAGALVVVDNTWSGGRYFNVFAHGGDISVHAATKYIVGHSDAMMGAVTCSEATWPRFKEGYETMGQFAGPDDMYLTLRGLRTIDVRLERHMKSALKLADWLKNRPEVEEVLYPALPGARGHELWRRDFTGASGLFSVVLKPQNEAALGRFLDGLELFSMGYSWGGFESLCVPFKPHRSAKPWTREGTCLRFHIGLEDPDDLMTDLAAGFERLTNAS